ncbi:MAG: 2-hydroxychromene-2-carboxylate isomerase [Herminiimonas sp.]|nr:2-hydroxychromene-2-carboxylate isomerase [Herminiimonas sp.]
MASGIDFYFDFSSPYGYFAAMRIEELAERHGRTVNWHPVLLGAIFPLTGARPLTQIPMRSEYSWLDFERTARLASIPYNRPPKFPIPTQTPARAMLWTREHHGEAKMRQLAKALFHAFFVDGVDISSAQEVARIAERLEIDPQELAAGIGSQEIKDRLRADNDAAVARGVFGSPFMFVDDEPFWGFDRFAHIEAKLGAGKT